MASINGAPRQRCDSESLSATAESDGNRVSDWRTGQFTVGRACPPRGWEPAQPAHETEKLGGHQPQVSTDGPKGSLRITCSTSSVNGAIPVLGAIRPLRCARCTS